MVYRPDKIPEIKTADSNILIVGLRHFPYGFAEIQRAILISKAFIVGGSKVCVIAKRSERAYHDKLDNEGTIEGVSYIFITEKYLKGILIRILNKPFIKLLEIRLIRRAVRNQNFKIALLSTNSFGSVVFYWLISRIVGFRIILNYVEYYSVIYTKNIRKKVSNKLFDMLAPRFVDAVIPISEFILQHLSKKKFKKNILKIPVVCDPERFSRSRENIIEKYFCYCGSTNYYEVIHFVMNSYQQIREKNSYKLYLILNGNIHLIENIKAKIKAEGNDENIIVFTNLPESQYNELLLHAKALLIPLRNNIQDLARFPHKVGEYTATGNPVISTNLGEISLYFKNMENILLCSAYDITEFCSKMEYVIQNPETVNKIGKKGKEVCMEFFNFRSYAKPLQSLINEML